MNHYLTNLHYKKMAFNHLSSMAKLMASPNLNWRMIRVMNDHHKELIKNPIYNELLQRDPQSFDKISLDIGCREQMAIMTSTALLGAIIIFIPYFTDPIHHAILDGCVHLYNTNPDDIHITAIPKINNNYNLINALVPTGLYTFASFWGWIRCSILLEHIKKEDK